MLAAACPVELTSCTTASCIFYVLHAITLATTVPTTVSAYDGKCGLGQELLEEGRRLFQVDYTALAPFVPKANAQKDNAGNRLFFMYATRAVFYLSNQGLLKPIAIELIDVPDAEKAEKLVRAPFFTYTTPCPLSPPRYTLVQWS